MSEVEQSSNEKNEIIKEKENLDDGNNINEENLKEQNQNNEEEKEDASLGEEDENNIEEEEEENYEDQKLNGEEEYNEEESSKKEGGKEKEKNINDEDVQNSKKEEEENSENENQKSLEEEKKGEDEQNKNEVNNEEKINGQDKEQDEENIKNDKEEEQIEIKSKNENNLNNEDDDEENNNNNDNNIIEEKEIIKDNKEEEEEEEGKELDNNEKEVNEQNQDNNEKEENKIIKDNKESKENELIQDNKEKKEEEENKNKEIIKEPNKTNPKKSEFKVIKNIEITHIQNNKLSGIEKERERPYTKREEKESVKKRIKEIEVNGRPHYVFYYKSSKTTDNSSMNTLDSMSYSNSKSRPNYQFLCSFGTKNSSQKRNQTYLLTSQKPITKTPIGIASTTAKTDIYNSPKNKLYDIISKSDMKATKSTNIFKPVPRTLIQTTKIQTRYQPRKYEYELQKKTYNKIGNCILLSNRQNKTINNSYASHNTTKYNSTKYEEKKQINKNSTFISYFHTNNTSNTSNNNSLYYQESDRDRPRVKYYIRCPNCNFPLNDEKEVNKIYSQKSFNSSYESRRKNLEKDSYANKTYIKSSCTDYNKYKFQTISNISNNKKEDISLKNGKIGSHLFRSCIQNSINFSSPKEKPVRSSKRHHNFYQSYGTSATSGKNPTKF